MNASLAARYVSSRVLIALAMVSCTLLAQAAAQAQEMEVPVALQVPLFLKVLTFDRQRPQNDESEIVFGIAYQSGFRSSAQARNMVAEAVRSVARVRIVLINLDRESLESILRNHKVQLLYVAPLRAMSPAAVAGVAAANHALTVTGVPQYVEQGVAVGLRLQGERPRIMVNLTASKLCGADFTSELLKLAEVYQ